MIMANDRTQATAAAPELPEETETRPRGSGSAGVNCYMTFGAWIKSAREFHGMTLEEVAERAGTSKSYVSELEHGKSVPTIDTAQKLARVFGQELWRVLKKIGI